MENEMRELVSQELETIFKDTFKLSEKDIKKYIEKILDEKDEEVILSLTDFFLKFEKYNKNNTFSIDRARAGKLVLDRCIKMYLTNKEKIKNNFFTAMDFAIKQNIDPIKIATMENLRGLTLQIYNNTYETLTQIQYKNPITGQSSTLFNDNQFKELIENCASLICHVNAENVEEIVSILNRFTYDEKDGVFLANTTELIKNCGSLLTYPSDKLSSNIAFLKSNFVPPMTDAELVVRISKSPSILLCDQTKINNFEKCIHDNLIELQRENPLLFPGDEAFESYAKSYARKATFNIEKLSSISGLTHENLSRFTETKNVLVKYLGAKNALETFTDFNVLAIEPKILDGLLAKLTVYDNENKAFLRKFFVEHTARALNMIQEDQLSSAAPSRKTGRTVTPRRVKADLESMPDQIENERPLTNSDQRTVNSLFENVKQTFEARKQRKMVDGVLQLSEEEQEEQEYMREVFDRVQKEFDVQKCNSTLDELISRVEAMIDAKEGKGYANGRYGINRMRHIDKIYQKSCKEAKELCDRLFPIYVNMKNIQSQAADVLNKETFQYISLCKDYEKVIRQFDALVDKIEDIRTTVYRYVICECKKIFKDIGVQSNKNPCKDGGYYFEESWFDNDHNSTLLIMGMTLSQTQLAYAQYLRDVLQEMVTDAEDNTLYSLAIDNLGCQQIDFRYMIYATRMRASIMNLNYTIIKDLERPLSLSGLVEFSHEFNNKPLAVDKMKNDMEKYMQLNARPSYSLLNAQTNIIHQLRTNKPLANDACRTMLSLVKALNNTNHTVQRILKKKDMGSLSEEYECYGKLLHTNGGILFFPYIDQEVGVFMVEPEVEKNAKEIEYLGVNKIPEKGLESVNVINYTFTEHNFTPQDEKALLPATLISEEKTTKGT